MAANREPVPPSSEFTAGQLSMISEPSGTGARPSNTSQRDDVSIAASTNISLVQDAGTAERGQEGSTNTCRQRSKMSGSEEPDHLADAQKFHDQVARDFDVALPPPATAVTSELSEKTLTAVLDAIVDQFSNFKDLDEEELAGSMVSRPATLRDPVQQRCLRYSRERDGQWLTDLTELRLIAAIVAVCEIPPTEKAYQAIFERVKVSVHQDLETS